MLSPQDNATLTEVSPGTPMGVFLRRFWLPAALSSEIPTPDCPPVRVRMLGEDLIAFRDTEGHAALVQAACPHRRTSLYWGRNELGGIRCAYHGWKFDGTGRCVDMPAEPDEASFKDKIRITAYPCEERGGLVWAYMGPSDLLPEIPGLEWLDFPPERRYITKRIEHANWVQAVEGGIDSAHSNYLHSTVPSFRLDPAYLARAAASDSLRARYHALDRSPRFFVHDTDYGMLIGARRNAESDSYYWRITHWLMPSFNLFGGISADGSTPIGRGILWVPADNVTSTVYSVSWRWDAHFTEPDIEAAEAFSGPVYPGSFEPAANMGNDYLIDRSLQREVTFTGLGSIQTQDLAVQEAMGAVVDRSLEHLGTSDTAIIRARRKLLQGATDLLEGSEPYQVNHKNVYRVRAADTILSRERGFDGPSMEEHCRISERD